MNSKMVVQTVNHNQIYNIFNLLKPNGFFTYHQI